MCVRIVCDNLQSSQYADDDDDIGAGTGVRDRARKGFAGEGKVGLLWCCQPCVELRQSSKKQQIRRLDDLISGCSGQGNQIAVPCGCCDGCGCTLRRAQETVILGCYNGLIGHNGDNDFHFGSTLAQLRSRQLNTSFWGYSCMGFLATAEDQFFYFFFSFLVGQRTHVTW